MLILARIKQLYVLVEKFSAEIGILQYSSLFLMYIELILFPLIRKMP